MISQSEFFASVGPAPLSFENVGDNARGIVKEITFKAQTDYNDRSKPATYNDGIVVYVMVVTIATEDGDMLWYVQNASRSALLHALKRIHRAELAEGDTVDITYTGKSGRTKLYAVTVS